MIIALSNDHITSIATPTVQVASTRRVFLNRCYNLKKLVTNRKQSIFQSKIIDAGISITNLDSEDINQFVLNRFQFSRNAGNLS